jgi:hypothetical protein
MDFRRPRPGKPGGIRYLFDCGAFSDASLTRIVVQPEGDDHYDHNATYFPNRELTSVAHLPSLSPT